MIDLPASIFYRRLYILFLEIRQFLDNVLSRKTGRKEIEYVDNPNRTAYELCHDVDATDTPHVALTIHLGGKLWTRDRRLKQGLQRKGFEQFFEPAR